MTKFYEADLAGVFKDWDDITVGGVTIKGIFHNAYEAVSLFNQEIESKAPFIQARDSDLAGLTHASILTINAVAYNPISIEPDGTGVTIVRLTLSPTPAEPQKIVTEAGDQIVTETGESLET